MRKVKVATFVSLDGVMQAPGGPDEDPTGGFKFGGWQAPFEDEAVGAAVMAFMDGPFDLLLGRKTYEIFSAFWPHQHDEIGKKFDSATKYVVTNSKPKLSWDRTVALHDAAADVGKLRKEDGPDLHIWGSATLIQGLLKHGLIDEMTLMTYPLLLGAGKKLFSDAIAPATLKVTNTKSTPAGVHITTYVPAGPVRTGTMGPDNNPSADELARREKWEQEDR